MNSPEYKNLPPTPTYEEVLSLGAEICLRDGSIIEHPGNESFGEDPSKEYVIDPSFYDQLDLANKFADNGIESIKYVPQYNVDDEPTYETLTVEFATDANYRKEMDIVMNPHNDEVSATIAFEASDNGTEGIDNSRASEAVEAVEALFGGELPDDVSVQEKMGKIAFMLEHQAPLEPTAEEILDTYDTLGWMVDRHE